MSQRSEDKSKNFFIAITGASTGIGEACACRFHKEGYSLLLLDHKKNELEKRFGKEDNVMIEEVDVSKHESMCRAFEKAEKSFGPCGCLINNAGLTLLGKMEEQELEEWEKMLKVNVCGVLHGIRCVLKTMKEKKCGTIINISSEGMDECFKHSTMFCATKAAVNAITEGVRKEAAVCGVKVTTICPGLVEGTGFMEPNKNKEEYQNFSEIKKKMPDGLLKPEDVADACCYVFKLPRRVCIRDLVIAPTNQTICT